MEKGMFLIGIFAAAIIAGIVGAKIIADRYDKKHDVNEHHLTILTQLNQHEGNGITPEELLEKLKAGKTTSRFTKKQYETLLTELGNDEYIYLMHPPTRTPPGMSGIIIFITEKGRLYLKTYAPRT